MRSSSRRGLPELQVRLHVSTIFATATFFFPQKLTGNKCTVNWFGCVQSVFNQGPARWQDRRSFVRKQISLKTKCELLCIRSDEEMNLTRALHLRSNHLAVGLREWRPVSGCRNLYPIHFMSSGHGSYVQKMKYLQNLKEKAGFDQTRLTNAKFLVFNKSKPLLTEEFKIVWMDFAEFKVDSQLLFDASALLGLAEEWEPQFAVQISTLGSTVKSELENKTNGIFTDFRLALLTLPNSEVSLVSKGLSVLNWHRKNRFCPNCGKETIKNSSGFSRKCLDCQEIYYPHLSPVGIVLVMNESRSKILLVRQSRHPKGMYTCIAGYVDAGETLEDSIRREIAEEVGLNVKRIEYKASQHWPLPVSNLMIGCHAIVNDEEIDMDKSELQDAKWFTFKEVKEAFEFVQKNPLVRVMHNEEEQFFVPPRGAVAHDLIGMWLQQNQS